MDYYWELVQYDGTRIEVPPEAVPVVQRRWDNGEPIHTSDMTIPANQIKFFRKTSKRHSAQPLLEAAAQAFNEPVIDEATNSIKARWVKKHVPQREYTKHYAQIPAYRKLGEDSGMIVVAFAQPVHMIDTNKVEYCTEEEIQQLTRS